MVSFPSSGLNPHAPPFVSASLATAARDTGPPPVGLLPPQRPCPVFPPPVYAGMGSCFCWCGGGRFASKGCSCSQSQLVGLGMPAFTQPAMVHPPPVPPVKQYYFPPPPPPPAAALLPPPVNRCRGVDGSVKATLAESGAEPSPRSVLPSRPPPNRPAAGPPPLPAASLSRPPPTRRAAKPPPLPAASLPRPRALGGSKARRGWRPSRLASDPASHATSLMIRNIPNKFMKDWFVAMLDQHCAEENAKLQPGGGVAAKSEYDFVYLPIDFGTNYNKGYAFVNMTTAAAARRLRAFLQGHSWAAAGSSKVCDVVPARLAGLGVLVAHFADSRFPCSNEEFLPVRFRPPRDGVRRTAGEVIGRMVSHL